MAAGTWCLGALVVLSLLGSGCAQTAEVARPAPPQTDRVLYVVDGDTVQLERLGRARLIGVDTPELREGECGAAAARAFLRGYLGDREVIATVGRAPVDRYGRTLVRLRRVDGARPVGDELVRRGLARVLTIAPNDEDGPRLEQLQIRAQRASLGVWRSCPTTNNTTNEGTTHAG